MNFAPAINYYRGIFCKLLRFTSELHKLDRPLCRLFRFDLVPFSCSNRKVGSCIQIFGHAGKKFLLIQEINLLKRVLYVWSNATSGFCLIIIRIQWNKHLLIDWFLSKISRGTFFNFKICCRYHTTLYVPFSS